jgi:hypothetical protein
VSVFWNLAMYGADMLFVENDFGRCSIGSTTDGLKESSDGSLTLRIQKQKRTIRPTGCPLRRDRPISRCVSTDHEPWFLTVHTGCRLSLGNEHRLGSEICAEQEVP